ncbi:MAG TPA: RNA helicase, partial [Methylotenera sp.]|nr:RNA helicase [Methylotenera sp.]
QPTKNLSEAARHQSMPQTGLFVPPSPSRHQPNRQNTAHGKPRNPNANSNNMHRNGGRGR